MFLRKKLDYNDVGDCGWLCDRYKEIEIAIALKFCKFVIQTDFGGVLNIIRIYKRYDCAIKCKLNNAEQGNSKQNIHVHPRKKRELKKWQSEISPD